jgi:hypothetical protein
VPLAGPEFSPGKRTDFWAQMITFTEVAALAAALDDLATILKQRAPGMTLARMPLFLWSMLVTGLHDHLRHAGGDAGSSFLISDRLIGTHFYNPAEGGDAAAVAAPVLVLRPPGGLHHLPAGAGHGLAHRHHLLAADHLRLSGHGAGPAGQRRSSPSACGCTTCSPPACRGWATASTPRPA